MGYSTLGQRAAVLNRPLGVGWWALADAERFAAGEPTRLGIAHVITTMPTPFGTHDVHFVHPIDSERRAA